MSNLPIRTGTWADETAIGALLALSFAADPFVRWINPTARQMIDDSAIHPRRAYAAAFDSGTVDILGDFAGMAVWIPPGAAKAQRDLDQPASMPAFGPPELGELLARSAKFTPQEPHWHLGLLAVDPACRGQGLGSVLLRHGLARADADALPTYLESTNEANLSVYRRQGFTQLATVRVAASPPRFPMLRHPGHNPDIPGSTPSP